MDGFTAALNPSLGLIECCRRRRFKPIESFCSNDCVEADGLSPEKGEVNTISPCGVGIGFLQDKSGSFFVSTLTPEGVYELKIVEMPD